MDALQLLMQGFAVALQPHNLMWALLGCTLGTAIGVLPGIGPALTVALLVPITVSLSPESAFIIFAGVFYGAMYGGSTTSILLNTPGESGSMITALEGNRMARSGRGAAALATAAIGSFVAGTIATIGLTLAAPTIAEIAFIFGPQDYFALMVLALTSVSVVLGTSRVRGFVALALGLMLGCIGLDSITGQQRLTFGTMALIDGVDLTVVLVSLFAIGEILFVASRYSTVKPQVIAFKKGKHWLSREDWSRSWKPWLRGTLLGFPIGAMPAGGSEIPTFLSYAIEKRLSKHPEEFGKGAIEGVAGPEAANNAAAAGVLVPLLTLGLPTSATAAVMLAALQNYGLQPGPMLFQTNTTLVWGLIASLYVGNFMLLVLNLPLIGVWIRLLTIPRPQLYGGIFIFALVGIWGVSQSTGDLAIMLGVGLVGYLMRLYSFPIAPVIVGLILGPLAELQLRRSMQVGQGDPAALVSSNIALTLWIITAIIMFGPPLFRLVRSVRHRAQA